MVTPPGRPPIPTDRILDAARAVFAEAGFAGADMAAIAARAGTTKPTLYAHFDSKDGLFAHALRREGAVLTEALLAALDAPLDLPLRERHRRYVDAVFRLARDRPHGLVLLLAGDRHPVAVAARAEVRAAIAERIAQLLAADNQRPVGAGSRLVAVVLMDAVEACALEAITRDADLEAAAELAASMLHAAVGALERPLLDRLDAAATGG